MHISYWNHNNNNNNKFFVLFTFLLVTKAKRKSIIKTCFFGKNVKLVSLKTCDQVLMKASRNKLLKVKSSVLNIFK